MGLKLVVFWFIYILSLNKNNLPEINENIPPKKEIQYIENSDHKDKLKLAL